MSIVLYDDPPSPEEVTARLAEAGLARIGGEARGRLASWRAVWTPAIFGSSLKS